MIDDNSSQLLTETSLVKVFGRILQYSFLASLSSFRLFSYNHIRDHFNGCHYFKMLLKSLLIKLKVEARKRQHCIVGIALCQHHCKTLDLATTQ